MTLNPEKFSYVAFSMWYMRKMTFNIVPFSVSKVPVTLKYGFEEKVGLVKDTF